MSILMFSNSPRKKEGGAEHTFAILTDELRRKGHRLYVLYNEPDEKEKNKNERSVDENSIHLRYLTMRGRFPTPRSIGLFVASLVRLCSYLLLHRPAVVYCHYVDLSSIYFALLKPYFGFRLILGGRGSDILWVPTFSIRHQRLIPFCLRKADHFIGVSQSVVDAAIELEPALLGRTSIIPNGVDFNYWKFEGKNEDRVDNFPILFSAGRLELVKGHDVMVNAMPKIARKYLNAKLLLAGQGNEMDSLKSLADKLGIRERVHFIGWCSRDKIREVLHLSDLFVMPSRSEGFGNAILEAMAAGVPIVASNVGGIPHVLNYGEAGILVKPDDPMVLAKTIIAVLDSPERRATLRDSGLNQVQSVDWDKISSDYERVFFQEELTLKNVAV